MASCNENIQLLREYGEMTVSGLANLKLKDYAWDYTMYFYS